MSRYDRWELTEEDYRPSPIADAGLGALRITLLFGSAAVALALIVVPVLDRGGHMLAMQSSWRSAGIDNMQTGSIGATRRYTIQRSVLQSSPNAICIINGDGTRVGDCY